MFRHPELQLRSNWLAYQVFGWRRGHDGRCGSLGPARKLPRGFYTEPSRWRECESVVRTEKELADKVDGWQSDQDDQDYSITHSENPSMAGSACITGRARGYRTVWALSSSARFRLMVRGRLWPEIEPCRAQFGAASSFSVRRLETTRRFWALHSISAQSRTSRSRA